MSDMCGTEGFEGLLGAPRIVTYLCRRAYSISNTAEQTTLSLGLFTTGQNVVNTTEKSCTLC
jgi:hypothetical protein